MTQYVIDVDQLHPLLGTPRVRILDVRWTLGKPNGYPDYLENHIPGATYVSLDEQLSSHRPDQPHLGRHPLPSVEEFQQTLRCLSVDEKSTVVIYDDASSLAAARAWWLFVWAGLTDVRVLNGGLAAWKEAGYELEHGPDTNERVPSSYAVTPSLPTTDAAGAAELARTGILIDSRATERYRGDNEPMDPKAGHIPGAINRPTTLNTPDGLWLSEDELRKAWNDLGVLDETGKATAEVGVYCGSGVTACHNALSLMSVGVTPVLYGPSWSGWSSDDSNPVATGDPAS